ncbi:hypothetical protein AYO22_00185 [Fonsecaea multimorphosa]|nr:hypothetical protein AYO22_00185 [Fonsecaea multimorphosa]
MYELGDTRLRRRRQWDDVLRGIRGGAGDEAEINSQNEHAPTTNEPDCRDDQDSERYLESMSEYLELEDLLEATINDLDELESHHDGTLLREALTLKKVMLWDGVDYGWSGMGYLQMALRNGGVDKTSAERDLGVRVVR